MKSLRRTLSVLLNRLSQQFKHHCWVKQTNRPMNLTSNRRVSGWVGYQVALQFTKLAQKMPFARLSSSMNIFIILNDYVRSRRADPLLASFKRVSCFVFFPFVLVAPFLNNVQCSLSMRLNYIYVSLIHTDCLGIAVLKYTCFFSLHFS